MVRTCDHSFLFCVAISFIHTIQHNIVRFTSIPGTVGGSGGGFFPLSKGFEPIKAGLTPPAKTAFVGALCFHLYLNTSLSEGTIDAKKKAHVFLTLYFIAAALVSALGLTANKTKVKSKKE